MSRDPDEPRETPTRRVALAGLGIAALAPACRRAWTPPEDDPTSRSQVKPDVPGSERYATYEEKWFHTSCAQCPEACALRVRVVAGRAVRVDGNRAHPVQRGRVCVRGLASLQGLYDADRIRGPLAREGGALVPVTWDRALDRLGGALAELRARAPERLLAISGLERGFVHELLARFCEAYGTPSFVDGSPGHGAAMLRAMELTCGVRQAPASIAHARTILSLEAALFEAGQGPSHDARLVHAGPAFDLAAYNAHRWLQVAPGTSGALALGVCHVLLAAGTYDRELVDRAGGVRELRALVERFTPEHVAAITGIAPEQVAEVARMLWNGRPAAIVVDERSLAFTNGVDTARAALSLQALLGSLQIAPEPPYAPWPAIVADDVALRGRAAPRLDMLPAAIAASPPQIALLYHANPAYSRAQPKAWAAALAKIPLVVSFSPYLDETTAAVAHLVLPDATAFERFDDATPAPGAPRAFAGVRSPVVERLVDVRPTGDVVLELARRIGGPVARALPWPSARAAFEERWLGLHAIGRGTLVEANPRTFLDRLLEVGFWAEADDTPRDPPSIELAGRWDLPEWTGDPLQFPLVLVAYRPLGGDAANEPWLRTLRSRPGLADWTFAAAISPHDAPRGLAEGDLVRVTSPHGELVAPAHLDARLAPGCVAIPTGGGHQAFGRWARGFGANVMELLPARAELCTTRVRITRVEEA